MPLLLLRRDQRAGPPRDIIKCTVEPALPPEDWDPSWGQGPLYEVAYLSCGHTLAELCEFRRLPRSTLRKDLPMYPLTPLQSLALLCIVLAIVACILCIAREVRPQTRTPAPAAQRPETDGSTPVVRIAVHRPNEPYDHEKHGL
ncbi:hypothetical protein QBA78_36275 [Streptomyces scabiei]|uniref:hypothetical protein n=1 Tax=Streptomyces scabiei TaxID=1930 RepID=UPI002FF37085